MLLSALVDGTSRKKLCPVDNNADELTDHQQPALYKSL
jgi:hypothetical protein